MFSFHILNFVALVFCLAMAGACQSVTRNGVSIGAIICVAAAAINLPFVI